MHLVAFDLGRTAVLRSRALRHGHGHTPAQEREEGRKGGGGPGNRRHLRPESGQLLGTASWEPVSSCGSRETRPGAALAGNRREGLLGSVVHLAKVTHPEPPHSEKEYSERSGSGCVTVVVFYIHFKTPEK